MCRPNQNVQPSKTIKASKFIQKVPDEAAVPWPIQQCIELALKSQTGNMGRLSAITT